MIHPKVIHKETETETERESLKADSVMLEQFSLTLKTATSNHVYKIETDGSCLLSFANKLM